MGLPVVAIVVLLGFGVDLSAKLLCSVGHVCLFWLIVVKLLSVGSARLLCSVIWLFLDNTRLCCSAVGLSVGIFLKIPTLYWLNPI